MPQHYSDPSRADDPHALPDIEVFESVVGSCPRCAAHSPIISGDDRCGACVHYGTLRGRESSRKLRPLKRRGWYWWACLPGCLPDSDPVGPFASEEAALADAREGVAS